MRRSYLLAAAGAVGALGAASAFAAAGHLPDVVGQMGLKPGSWHTTVRVVDVKVTPVAGKALPADAEAKFRSKIGQQFETDDCIRLTRAPNEDLKLPGISIGSACALDEVVADRQNLRLHARCGDYAVMDVKATHTDSSMLAEVDTLASPTGVPFTVNITLATKSSHVGECR